MKLILIIVTTSFLLGQPVDPLQWTKYYGGSGDDFFWSIIQTSEPNYLLGGYSNSFGAGSLDFWLVKVNAYGDTIWSRTYGGSSNDRSFAIVETAGGGYAITGETFSFGNGLSDIWLIRTDPNGDTLFTRTYGNDGPDHAVSLLSLEDNGFLIVGSISNYDPDEGFYFDVFVSRTDSLGDTLWTCSLGGDNDDMGWAAVETPDQCYLVVAMTKSYGAGDQGRSDIWLIKINDNGDVLWTRTYGGEETDQAYHILQTLDHNYVLVGWSDSYGAESEDGLIIKVDGDGEVIWTRIYGGPDDEKFWHCTTTPDSGLVLVGYNNPENIDDRIRGWMFKVDSNGDSLWSKYYPEQRIIISNAVVSGISEGLVFTGWSYSDYGAAKDAFIVKCDSLGNTQPALALASSPIPRSTFQLECYPNPFNTIVNLKYTIYEPSLVRLSIYDLKGRKIWIQLINHQYPGTYTLAWDALNEKGLEISTGIYILSLSGSAQTEYRKIVLIK